MKAREIYDGIVGGDLELAEVELVEFCQPITPNAGSYHALARALEKAAGLNWFDLSPAQFATKLAQEPRVGPGTAGTILCCFALLGWLQKQRDSQPDLDPATLIEATDDSTEDVEGNDHAD